MGKIEIHWPATLKVPRVSKREHLSPLPTATLFSGYSNMPHQCQMGKRRNVERVTGVWKGEKKWLGPSSLLGAIDS